MFINNYVLINRVKGCAAMFKKTPFEEECDFFSAKRLEDVVIINFKENLLFHITDLSSRDQMLHYLDRISETDSIKVVAIISSKEKKGSEEYFDFYHQVLASPLDLNSVCRLQNVFAQFILRIIDLNKIVIHADRGRVISLFLNLSLACDYRIVADTTLYQNPSLKLGLVPVGGGAFFLSRRLGRSKALEILMSENDINAQEALRLGIVDKVVARDKLEEAALGSARRFAQKPARSLAGVKKLINYTIKDLNEYMAFEQKEFVKIITHNRWDENFTTNSCIGI